MTQVLNSSNKTQLARIAEMLDKQIFFIVGCQKSGTTWIQKLLDGHPSIRCHGEGYFGPLLMPIFQQAFQTYNQRQKAGEPGRFTADEVNVLFSAAIGLSFSRWVGDQEVSAVGEKTPENALCMPQLAHVFPNAKFIHIIRDGRDVCVSGWFHNQRKAGPQFAQRFPDLNTYIQYTVTQHWVPYIQKARSFGESHPDQYIELKYESLHENAADLTAHMLDFLGVDDSEASIQACLDAGSFNKLADGRSRGEENNQSFFRKGVIGDWQNHFDEANRRQFDRVGGQMLQLLGYAA